MTARLLLCALLGCSLAGLGGCAPLTSERGTLILEPARLATYENYEHSADFVCGLDPRPFPPTISEDDLAPDEVGAGFRNWYRRENLCGRRYTWVYQALVQFDPQPIRELGLAGITRATLRVRKRPMMRDGDPPAVIQSVSDGLITNDHCARLRLPRERWVRGYHQVRNREDLIATAELPVEGDLSLRSPSLAEQAIDVTGWVRRPLRTFPDGYEFAFESVSDLRYLDNNEFCLHVLGDLRLEVEYARIRRAEP